MDEILSAYVETAWEIIERAMETVEPGWKATLPEPDRVEVSETGRLPDGSKTWPNATFVFGEDTLRYTLAPSGHVIEQRTEAGRTRVRAFTVTGQPAGDEFTSTATDRPELN